MSLSDTAIKALKPLPDKPYKVADEKGLIILVNPNGSKYWRFNYRFNGKRKTLAMGVYPDTSLKQAREKRDAARKQIGDDVDPSELKKDIAASASIDRLNTFEAVAIEWGVKNYTKWLDSRNTSRARLEQHIFPALGHKPVREITPVQLLQCVQKLEARGVLATAQRTLRVCGQVFRYAVATGRADRDITADLKGALKTPKTINFASLTKPAEVAVLLRAIDGYTGTFTVRSALQLAPLLFVRNNELRQAEWEHIDLITKEWRFFVSKTQQEHIVPLSIQAVEILAKLHAFTGHGRYVFPNMRTPNGDTPMSGMALSIALRITGYTKDQMTIHGFRAMARTILDEVLGFRPDFIEHQLAHAVRDANGRAYNRTSHIAERHKMMQSWADYLDALKNGAQVLPFKKIG